MTNHKADQYIHVMLDTRDGSYYGVVLSSYTNQRHYHRVKLDWINTQREPWKQDLFVSVRTCLVSEPGVEHSVVIRTM